MNPMKIIGFWLALVLLMDSFTSVSFGGQSNPKEASAVVQLLRSGKVQRLEIIYYPEKIQTRARLTPDMLENQYRYKLIVNDAQSSAVGQDVIAAIEADSLTASDQQADFRWGCSFYDSRGERLTSLYFDAFGKIAMVDTVLMTSSGRVVKCLQRICAGFRK